ncbi:Hypothetical protein HVR_LOCUS1224 [uncultured virus]|nr:Hypothetical protein HVR_LOCUS1224 [uncultured virus]
MTENTQVKIPIVIQTRTTNSPTRNTTTEILNNRLSWDGSHLGSAEEVVIRQQWSIEGTTYQEIFFPPGWVSPDGSCSVPNGGIIYCMTTCPRDLFPCIVEDLKSVFGLPRRGIHRIDINNKDYILYYVPISEKGAVVWETPLNRLDTKHYLRSNPKFRKSVQKTIAFCDILALCSTGETQIRIRPGTGTEFIPISFNENSTAISKCAEYDYSILTKTLFSKWFGEDTPISDIVKEMVHYNQNLDDVEDLPVDRAQIDLPDDETEQSSVQAITQTGLIFNKIPTVKGIGVAIDNLAVLTADIRNKVDTVVRRYDSSYIWYSSFIVERMSRHLLID